jgi:threonine/homoserine/homoserine lactone efflux protein
MMTLEAWLAFAATATAFLLVPNPLASLTAAFSASWGRASGFVTVPSAILSIVVSAVPATAIAFALSFYWPSAVEAFSWAGLAFLMLYILYAYQDPKIRGGLADNDNLPATRPIRVIGYFIASALRQFRYFAIAAAMAIQVIDPALSPGEQYLQIVGAFAVAAGLALCAYALFPRRLTRKRRRSTTARHALQRPGTLFIARRAVTAGYRRIAA